MLPNSFSGETVTLHVILHQSAYSACTKRKNLWVIHCEWIEMRLKSSKPLYFPIPTSVRHNTLQPTDFLACFRCLHTHDYYFCIKLLLENINFVKKLKIHFFCCYNYRHKFFFPSLKHSGESKLCWQQSNFSVPCGRENVMSLQEWRQNRGAAVSYIKVLNTESWWKMIFSEAESWKWIFGTVKFMY